MKTAKSILIVLIALSAAQISSAYYCPSTGHWLSRDPMGEPGFQVLQALTHTTTAQLSSGRWINRDVGGVGEEGSGLNLSKCASCKKRAFMKDKMAVNEPNFYGFVQNAPIEQVDSFGLFAALNTGGIWGCKDHANEINAAWKTATALIQQWVDANKFLSFDPDLLECMENSKATIGFSCSSCNPYRVFTCHENGNTANVNYATHNIELCSSFFQATPCQQAEILAVEASKLDCNVNDINKTESKFAGWLNSHLCNQ